MFKLLLLLYQDKADYESVKDIFKNDFDDEQSTNNIQVVLNKYLNTLKVFGINVKKVNNQYKLLNNLYAMNFSEDDLKSINILSNSIKTFPEENTSSDIKKFIHELKIRMNYEDRNKLNNTKMMICVCKTPMSITDDKLNLGYPKDFKMTVTDIKVYNGAGFIVVYMGNVLLMPGMPKNPNYLIME